MYVCIYVNMLYVFNYLYFNVYSCLEFYKYINKSTYWPVHICIISATI